jgi:hypothetical protein
MAAVEDEQYMFGLLYRVLISLHFIQEDLLEKGKTGQSDG